MLSILLAPDKFKGSLSAEQVCAALSEGLLKKYPNAVIISTPLADGGEGTSELLTRYFNGTTIKIAVSNPLFEPITATYGYASQERIAFIEMAKASGLELIAKKKRNPLYTTTYGTGELIKDALDRGAKKIVLGIGGSATNDAGIGMAEALGFQFFDKHNQRIKPIGENLIHLHHINFSHIDPRIKETEFNALCDVINPLYGINGAGGGIASGAAVFLNASIKKGIDYMIDAFQLEEKIKQADLIITGEGKIDHQTLSGKVVAAIAQLAQQHHKKVIAVCGVCQLKEDELSKIGIHQTISLANLFTSPEVAIKNASLLLRVRVDEIEM